jgi:AraC-like DNA-binding protein
MKVLTFRSKFNFKDLILLLPAIGMVTATIVVYLLMTDESRRIYIYDYLYGNGHEEKMSLLIQIQLILSYALQFIYFLQITFSFFKIRIFIRDYNANIANFYSNLENKTLQWPIIILYSFVITSMFTIITNFLGRSFFDKYPIFLLITGISYGIFLFVLGFLGFLQNHRIDLIVEDATLEVENISVNPNNNKIKIQLINLFENEKVYKHPELKISDLATQLYTNRTYLSNLINSEYNCSFSTFVNHYRVEEAKKQLLNEDNDQYSLEYISVLAGFGSLHSFIRVFKEITNTTPGRFRESTSNHPTE